MRAGKTLKIFLWILLGVAAIVVMLLVVIIGFLMPMLNTPRIYAKEVRQNAQFHSMDTALELFNNAFDGYPPSDALDPTGVPYCGAMKFCEAMLGRDLLGFHINSVFRRDGKDATDKDLYEPSNLSPRRGPFLPSESANVFKLSEIYGQGNAGPFREDIYVLCDTFTKKLASGKKAGMPILYYKADTSKTAHDVEDPDNPENIYNYKDNHALLGLGVPGKPDKKHPLFTNPEIFYKMTKNTKVAKNTKVVDKSAPIKADSFILISAGYDGFYGTADDIANFEWKWSDDGR